MRRRIALWMVAGAVFVLLYVPISIQATSLAQNSTIDQSNDGAAQSYLGTIVQQAQTFTVGRDGILDRVEVKGFRSSVSGQLTLQITAVDQNGAPIGPTLGSGSSDTSTLPALGADVNAGGWLSVAISPAVQVHAGVQYAIVKPAGNPFPFIWSFSVGNTYAQGQGTGDLNLVYDYLFRTYVLTPPTPTLTPTAGPTQSTVIASADSYVQKTDPKRNFGSKSSMIVDGTDDPREAYLRFSVNAAGAIRKAVLRLYVTDGTKDGPKLYQAANTTWSESTITWNNKPGATGPLLGNVGKVNDKVWIEYDVTSVVMANGTYSFVLVGDSTESIEIRSREGSNKPQLVLTVQP